MARKRTRPGAVIIPFPGPIKPRRDLPWNFGSDDFRAGMEFAFELIQADRKRRRYSGAMP